MTALTDLRTHIQIDSQFYLLKTYFLVILISRAFLILRQPSLLYT